MFWKKKTIENKSYDPEKETPILHCSICNGEQIAGFKNKETGHFKEIILIRNDSDLELFRQEYGITGDIEKEY
jgi:hypothetical protein